MNNILKIETTSFSLHIIRVSDEIIAILNRWNNEYLNVPVEAEKKGRTF